MKYQINKIAHKWALGREQFNNNETIKSDDSGRYIGDLSEFFFSKLLSRYNIPHTCVGKNEYHYDFYLDGISIDTKAKERTYNYESRPDRLNFDEGHVCLNQRDFDCQLYVFSNIHKLRNADIAESIEFVGWMKKKEFWEQCNIVYKGDMDGSFMERKDAGKLQYSKMRPMASLFIMLSDVMTIRRFG